MPVQTLSSLVVMGTLMAVFAKARELVPPVADAAMGFPVYETRQKFFEHGVRRRSFLFRLPVSPCVPIAGPARLSRLVLPTSLFSLSSPPSPSLAIFSAAQRVERMRMYQILRGELPPPADRDMPKWAK